MTTLLDLVPGLRKIATTAGGEYAGPCPLCGGRDRFHVQPAYPWRDGDTGAWFCRQCSPQWDDAPALVMRLHGVRYPDALVILGQPPSPHGRGAGGEGPTAPPPPPTPVPPDPAWQARAAAYAATCKDHLWSSAGERARAWLVQRGFTEEFLMSTDLGYQPADDWQPPLAWGLPIAARRVWLPRGIVIPWRAAGHLWNIEIRRPLTPAQLDQGEPKYVSVKGGSKQCLLGADHIDAADPVVLVEGALDRLAVRQAAADLVTVVAAGSTTGGRQSTWLLRLALAPQVLIAFDRDDPGEQAAAWWLQALGPRAVRWQPDPGFKDPNAMLQALGDSGLRAWVQAGLDHAAQCAHEVATDADGLAIHVTESPLPLGEGQGEGPSTVTDPCAICGQPFDRYDPAGRPLCADHYAACEHAEADWNALPSATQPTAPPTTEPAPPSSVVRRPSLYPIPPRTKPQRCNCGAEFYWVVVHDKPLPISINPELHPGSLAPTRDTAGAGINHFADCPLRNGFRRRKPPALDHPLDHPQPATTEAA